jgi:glycosyltransferase involved in cell wall biosynthesis
MHLFQPEVAGVPVYAVHLAAGLMERGWTTTVACPPGVRELAHLGHEARILDAPMTRLPSPRRDIAAFRLLARYVREAGVDLVHAHSTKAGWLAGGVSRRTGIPSVFTPHSWSFEMRWPLPLRMALAASERLMVRRLHAHVVAVCEHERQAGLRWRVLRRTGGSSVVLSSVQLPAAPPGREAARRRLGIPGHLRVVAWVGRNDAQKRPGDVVSLAGRLAPHGIAVMVMGFAMAGGPLEEELRRHGGRVLPPGTDVFDLYAAADVVVQTSAWEGLPLVVLEAMGMGLPIVAYDVGGVGEAIVPGATGYTVPPADVDAAARWCRAICDDDDLRRRLGDAARARSSRLFGEERMIDEIERVYARPELGGLRVRAQPVHPGGSPDVES